jgi:hypothetical protein
MLFAFVPETKTELRHYLVSAAENTEGKGERQHDHDGASGRVSETESLDLIAVQVDISKSREAAGWGSKVNVDSSDSLSTP